VIFPPRGLSEEALADHRARLRTFAHRALAAFRAIAVRLAFDSALALAGPPFFPSMPAASLTVNRCPLFMAPR